MASSRPGSHAAAPPAAAAPAAAAPLVSVVVGEEELLVERAVAAMVTAAAAAAGPDAAAPEMAGAREVRAADLAPGELAGLTAPSLFGGGSAVVIRSAQDAGKEIAAEILRYASSPSPETVLVLTHAGGAKGKALLGGLAERGAHRIDCPVIRRFGERMEFLREELARSGRKADQNGLRALLDAVGNDLRDLSAACSQLAADTSGMITQEIVGRYYRGRAEASGFTVADRTFEGNLADALEQLRWALAIGTSPVLITSALAQGARALGRVGTAARGRRADALAAELGMPPWKIDKVRQQLRGWTPDGVARALSVVAQTDAQVKGEGANAAYALEHAITTIVASRSRG